VGRLRDLLQLKRIDAKEAGCMKESWHLFSTKNSKNKTHKIFPYFE